jgi:ATP-dependent DNA helicase RecQ
LLYNQQELAELQVQPDSRFPETAAIKQIYFALMNYLHVPAGSGEGSSYDFDLLAFTRNFNLNLLTVTYALKAIEQEGFLLLSETVFLPATVVFTTDRNSLHELLTQYKNCEPIAKGLLRSYEGIFDYPVSINENALAKFVNLPREKVLEQLKLLHQLGIIKYEPQKDSPQIVLLRNRMFLDGFHINLTNYQQRKLLMQQRIAAIVDFATNSLHCRSQLIAKYFNAPVSLPCGVCDNCIQQKRTPISSEEFLALQYAIEQLMASNVFTTTSLLQTFPEQSRQKAMSVIEYLIAEEKIVLLQTEQLQLNK